MKLLLEKYFNPQMTFGVDSPSVDSRRFSKEYLSIMLSGLVPVTPSSISCESKLYVKNEFFIFKK